MVTVFTLINFSGTDNRSPVMTAFRAYKTFGPFMFTQIFNAIPLGAELPPELLDFGYGVHGPPPCRDIYFGPSL